MTLNSLLAVVTLYHLAVALAWTYCTHSDTAHARIQLLQWRGKMSLPGFGSTGSVASCGIAPATSLPIPPSCGSSLNLLHWLWHGSRSQSNFYSDVAKCRHLALVLPALSLAVVPPPLYHLAVALAWTCCTGSDTAHARNQTFTVTWQNVGIWLWFYRLCR